MKSKKMLKVLSTSFILGTILMTSPSFAEKVEGKLPVNETSVENTHDGQSGKEGAVVTNSIGNKETDSSSKESSQKEKSTNNDLTNSLEVSIETEKESVRANEDSEPELILPEAKFDKDMSIDDPATYDYTGYVVKHYSPTNEKFMKERNDDVYAIEDILTDSTDEKNEKMVVQDVVLAKGKDLSSKVDEYIAELEKNKGNKDVDFESIKTKVFGENSFVHDSSHFDSYINMLSNLYNSTADGDGDGHKIFNNGKLWGSDFSVENFKEIYKNYPYNKGIVHFTIDNSFKNRPIIWVYQVFLSEDQYFQYRDEILDFLKSEAGFKNLTSRHTSMAPYGVADDVNSQKLPNNIKNALSEEYIKEHGDSGINIVYDSKNINKDNTSSSKEDLKKSFEQGDFYTDKDAVNDNSFSLRVGFNLNRNNDNALPLNYYLFKNDKPIFKGSDKLAFKEKGDITGSEYYISNTITDRDDAIQRAIKFYSEALKDDEDFKKLS